MTPKTVKDIMTIHPNTVSPDNTLTAAAIKMELCDCGALLVTQNDTAQGIVTDRDIVIYGIAQRKNPDTTQIQEIMTDEVLTCYENEELERAADKLSEYGVRRLVVLNDDNKVSGILSIADIVSNLGGEDHASDEVLHHLYRYA